MHFTNNCMHAPDTVKRGNTWLTASTCPDDESLIYTSDKLLDTHNQENETKLIYRIQIRLNTEY